MLLGKLTILVVDCEKNNLELCEQICSLLDEVAPKQQGFYKEQIKFVTDRLGHDRRYAVDIGKIQKQLAWNPLKTFEEGIRETIQWYM